MIAGMLLMDLVWALGLAVLLVASGAAAFATFAAFPGPLGAGLVTWTGLATAIVALLPKPSPGRHPLLGDASFFLWGLGFVARRWLDLPPMGLLWRQSNLLRFVVLRACGARVHLSTSISSDAVLLDPNLLVVGPDVVIGSEAVIAGHWVAKGALLLAPVEIGPGVEISAQVSISPGVRIGANARLEPRASVGHEAVIGEGAVIGFLATVHPRAVVPPGTRVPPHGVVTA